MKGPQDRPSPLRQLKRLTSSIRTPVLPSLKQIKQGKQQRKPIRLPSVSNKINLNKTAHPYYYIGQILGEGAFAKVRKAVRKSDGQQCVIKMYDKFRINTQQRKQAIKNQIEILRSIKHDSIIEYIDFYQTADTLNLVMENFSNCSLAMFAKQNRPLNIDFARKITRSIAQALFYLHEKGVAHRDIKPQNILILQKGNKSSDDIQVKLIDFGLAMARNENEVKIVGTPQFMAPQLLKYCKEHSIITNIQTASYDPYKADVWALGVTLYWIALGYYPQINKKKYIQYPIDIHPGMEYLLSKMLRQDAQDRVSSEQILQDSWLKPIDLKAQISRLSKGLSRNLSDRVGYMSKQQVI